MIRLWFARAALTLLVLLAPSLASAQSSISWFANGAWQPTLVHQTPVRLHIQGKNADNSIAYEKDCSPFGNCAIPQASASYTVTLENFDASREEILAETCNGVLAAVPQQKCVNGPLRLNMKLRLGALNLTYSYTVAGANVQLQGNDGYRLEFVGDASKYWTLAGEGTVPAGSYHVTAVNPRATCEVVHANAGVLVNVPAGDAAASVNLVYTPTTCQLTVKVSATASAGGSLTGAPLDGSCASNGTTEVSCEATVSYGAELTLTAHPDPGSAPLWPGSGGNACAAAGTGTTCDFKVRGPSIALTYFVAAGDGGASTSSSGGIDAGTLDAGEDASTSSGGASSSSSSSGSGTTSSSSGADPSSSGNVPGPTEPESPNGGSPGANGGSDDGGCSSAPGTGSSLGVLATLTWLLLRRRARTSHCDRQ